MAPLWSFFSPFNNFLFPFLWSTYCIQSIMQGVVKDEKKDLIFAMYLFSCNRADGSGCKQCYNEGRKDLVN